MKQIDKKRKRKAAAAPLEAQLIAYSAESKAVTCAATGSGWKSALRHWPAYGVATAAALAGATSASAGIIYTPLDITISAGFGSGAGQQSAFLPGPGSSLQIRALVERTVAGTYRHGLAELAVAGGGVEGGSGLVSALNKSALISMNMLVPFTQILRKSIEPGPNSNPGNFLPGQTFYAGLGLLTQNGTALDFGWLKLKVEDVDNLPVQLDILGLAYTDDGSNILAGDTGTPEPSTAAMLLLAAGAAGIAAWKRQRKASA